MKRETAEKLVSAANRIDSILGELDSVSWEIEDEAERKRIRGAMAALVINLYNELTRLIVQQYPDLHPDFPPNPSYIPDPVTAFDHALLSHMPPDCWLKAARVIGAVQADTWKDNGPTPADVFLAGRLQALADAGLIEVEGDLSRIRHSEVRLAKRR